MREIWCALTLGCADTVLPLVTEDVRWRPYGDTDVVVEGRDGLREFLADLAAHGRSLRLSVAEVACSEERIVVRGRQREDAPGRIADENVWWVCRLRDGLLAEAETHISRPVLV